MVYEVLPFEIFNIQINVLIIQRTTCLHLQRSMLSKPGTPDLQKYEKISNHPRAKQTTHPQSRTPPHPQTSKPNRTTITRPNPNPPLPRRLRNLTRPHHVKNIQPQRINHQPKQQHHTHHLRILDKLITGLPTRDHLDQRKQRMPAIQRRDRQDIHKRQQYAKNPRQRPETPPVPLRREYIGNADNTPQIILDLHLFRRKQQFQVSDIVPQRLDTFMNTGRPSLQQRVRHMHLAENIRHALIEKTIPILFRLGHHRMHRILTAAESQRNRLLIFQRFEIIPIPVKITIVLYRMTFHGDKRIPLPDIPFYDFGTRQNGIDDNGITRHGKAKQPVLAQLTDNALGNRQVDLPAIPQHRQRLGLIHNNRRPDRPLPDDRLSFHSNDIVPILYAYPTAQAIRINTIL